MATLKGLQKDVGALLRSLITLDYDAIDAYSAAVERLRNASDKHMLQEFLHDHERHTRELAQLIRERGETPPTSGDFKRVLTTGKVVLAGLIDDTAILFAMKTNETDTNTAYARAVEHDNLPQAARDMFERALADERRHRAWLVRRIDRRAGADASA